MIAQGRNSAGRFARATIGIVGKLREIVDKMKAAPGRLGRHAAKKAAEAAVDVTAKAARGALDSMGDALEKAMFGDADEKKKSDPPPDPFAKLKAAERAKAKKER
jgi:hypothetical protein